MYKDILLPVDREHAVSWQMALPVAIDYCKAFGARLHVMTVVPSLGVGDVSSFLPMGFEQKLHAQRHAPSTR